MAAFRAMTPTERLTIADQLSSDVRALAKAGIRRRRPNATPDEVERRTRRAAPRPRVRCRGPAGPARRKAVSFADLLPEVIAHLDRSGIPFMVTGSLASSFHGEPRATRDLDMVIDPTPTSAVGVRARPVGFGVLRGRTGGRCRAHGSNAVQRDRP